MTNDEDDYDDNSSVNTELGGEMVSDEKANINQEDSEKEKVINALEVLTNYILTKNYERTGGTGSLQDMTNIMAQEA